MHSTADFPSRASRRSKAIALHCSGSGRRQWRALAEALDERCDLLTPEHYGCDEVGPWTGERAFTLADEAARSIALIDGMADKVHLVGHSYGGALALHIALTRPHRIASLSLYEPSEFHLLAAFGEMFEAPYAEISDLARRTARGVAIGNYHGAASDFVDYWSGAGAWDSLRPAVREAMVRWVPKAPLDFHALMSEATPPEAYRALAFPVLIMRGEHAPSPTRATTAVLASLLRQSRLVVIAGAGHMGPLTHAAHVAARVAEHIEAAEASAQPHFIEPEAA